jgi:hypothetical protein
VSALPPGVPSIQSLTELHSAHSALMEQLAQQSDGALPPDLVTRIAAFMESATKLGRRLSLAVDRADAQSVLTFWTVFCLGRG